MNQNKRFHGQSMIEFALIIPLVLALLMGFFDLGRAIIYNTSLSNAVREGSRSSIVLIGVADGTIEDEIKQEVLKYAFGLTTTTIPLTAADINVVITPDDKGFRDTLQVTVNYCFVPITPGIATIVGNNCANGGQGINLNAESFAWFEPSSYK